jgi:ABC-type nitrate/sulfonate/bicarbonate transport system permease component
MQDQRVLTILWRGKWLILAAVAVAVLLALLLDLVLLGLGRLVTPWTRGSRA